jgi:uncharacterized protein YecT (DUF1311 family)
MLTMMRAALLLTVAACAQTESQTEPQMQLQAQAQTEPPAPSPVPPSFDCSRVATVVEKQICATPEFASLDSRIAALLAQALTVVSARDAEALRGDQRAWLKDRDDCGSRAHGSFIGSANGSSNNAAVDACLRQELNRREGLLRVVVASRQFTKP